MPRGTDHIGQAAGDARTPLQQPLGMPEALAAAVGYRESGDSFPGLERYRQPTLRVGVSGSLSFGRLRALLGRIGAEHPDFQLQFEDAGAADLVAAVVEGRVDVGFVEGEINAPAGCKVDQLWTERLMVVLPEHHVLASENAIGRDALRRERFLVASPQAEAAIAERFIEQALDGPPQSMTCASVQRETLFNLVALGFGLSIAPASSLGAFYPGIAYRPFEGRQPHIPVSCLWRADNSNPQLNEIIALVSHRQQQEAGR